MITKLLSRGMKVKNHLDNLPLGKEVFLIPSKHCWVNRKTINDLALRSSQDVDENNIILMNLTVIATILDWLSRGAMEK